MNLYDVVKKLIGKTEPVGESNLDEEALENLKDLIILNKLLIRDLKSVAFYQDSKFGSMKKLGKIALNALNDIKLDIEDL